MNYEEFFALAKQKGITNIQIAEDTTTCNEVYFVNDKLEDYSDMSKTTYDIKGEYNGKIEQLHTEYLSESILDLLIEKIKIVDSNYENEFLESRKTEQLPPKEKVSTEKEMTKIKELYTLKRDYPHVKTMEFSYGDEYTETRIKNNKGADISTSAHVYKFSVEAVAEIDGESASFDRSVLTTDKNAIQYEKMTKEVLEKSQLLAVKKKLETKKYNIILDDRVVTRIMNSLIYMLSAKNIHKKMSCLENKLDKKIFSEKLTIVEEPQNKNYPGYTKFDNEGNETYNKKIIEKGILKTYLYDNKEAKVENKKSTGNNYGNISTRNMYINLGKSSQEELLQKMENGLYITKVMGSNDSSINESNGNISLQIFGYLVEDGKIISGFTPSIMTTTIFELLSNIEEIGNNMNFTKKEIGCPSLYIKDISIASE